MPVFSIGHGGRTPDELTTQLAALDIAYLLDVRSVPYSRYQPGFSRKPLEAHVNAHGLRYVYLGAQLGGRPADPALYDADGHVSYARLRTQPAFLDGIERIKTAERKGLRVCLLCAEAKPWSCHRARLIGAVLQADHGITVDHLLPPGDRELF